MEKFPYISIVNFKISLEINQYLLFRSSCSKMIEELPVLQARSYIKKKLQQSSFPVIVAKFLRAAFFIEHFRWLLLPFTTTFRNYYWKDHWITVNKDYVHSTPKKHLKKVLGMLQVIYKETQSLLLTFSIFHVLF